MREIAALPNVSHRTFPPLPPPPMHPPAARMLTRLPLAPAPLTRSPSPSFPTHFAATASRGLVFFLQAVVLATQSSGRCIEPFTAMITGVLPEPKRTTLRRTDAAGRCRNAYARPVCKDAAAPHPRPGCSYSSGRRSEILHCRQQNCSRFPEHLDRI